MENQPAQSTDRSVIRSVSVGLQALIIGGTAGGLVSGFLIALNWGTRLFQHHPILIYSLPVIGVATAGLYTFGPKSIRVDVVACVRGLSRPNQHFSIWSAPILALATVATHLGGGSAGREGTAVQIGAVVSDQFNAWVHPAVQIDRAITLRMGLAAGFAAALGTPWGGVMFAVELLKKRLSILAVIGIGVSAHVANWVRLRWIGSSADLHHFGVPGLSIASIVATGIVALVAASLARIVLAGIDHLRTGRITRVYWWVNPVVGGSVMALFATRYPVVTGLGLPTLNHAFIGETSVIDPIIKCVATIVTLGAGFKGGEFVPLVWIGATAGGALGQLLGISIGLPAAVGYLSAFVGGSNLPLTGIILGVSLFGFRFLPYAVLGCGIGALLSNSNHTMYHKNDPTRSNG